MSYTDYNMEMIDGFMTSLICSPDTFIASVELQKFINNLCEDTQEKEARKFLTKHWGNIEKSLVKNINKKKSDYFPLIYQDEKGNPQGNDWARGFVEGMSALTSDSWENFIHESENYKLLAPIFALDNEYQPNSITTPPPYIDKNDKDIVIYLIAKNIVKIYRYFNLDKKNSNIAKYSNRIAIGEQIKPTLH